MRIWNKSYLPLVSWSLSYLSAAECQQILDIGVGNGASTALLKKRYPKSLVYGIDISTEGIEEAEKRFKQEGITFERKDVVATGYESQRFDLICSFQTHFHWHVFARALNEIQRLLTPNGQIVIACEVVKIKCFRPELKGRAAVESLIQSNERSNYYGT